MCDGIEYKGKLFMFKKNDLNIHEQWFITKNFYTYIDKVFIKKLSKVWWSFIRFGCTFDKQTMQFIQDFDKNIFTNYSTKLSSLSINS